MDNHLKKTFVLFCAGEDSGDILGETFVEYVIQSGKRACGSGGERMRAAGLEEFIDYEHLPVSGFGDVFRSFRKLSRDLKKMRQALTDNACIAFVAIDYPGFNMNLVKLAQKLHKPVLYIAPPQIWAWKSNRGKQLRGVPLAVFFHFEKEAYRKFGCNVRLMRHPLLDVNFVENVKLNNEIIFLPGSRISQALRNLDAFLKIVVEYACTSNKRLTIFAVRESLVKKITDKVNSSFLANANVVVEKAPQSASERLARYSKATLAFVCPGTATLEIAFTGCPMVVCTKPDAFTYLLGRLLVNSRTLSLPNLIIGENFFAEFVAPPFIPKFFWKKKLLNLCQNSIPPPIIGVSELLHSKLSDGVLAQELMLEFLCKFCKS